VEINRNQWFLAGVIVLLLGIQFRLVNSFVLNQPATDLYIKATAKNQVESAAMMTATSAAPSLKVVTPPEWIGWCLMSVGSVFVLHSLAMKRPD